MVSHNQSTQQATRSRGWTSLVDQILVIASSSPVPASARVRLSQIRRPPQPRRPPADHIFFIMRRGMSTLDVPMSGDRRTPCGAECELVHTPQQKLLAGDPGHNLPKWKSHIAMTILGHALHSVVSLGKDSEPYHEQRVDVT